MRKAAHGEEGAGEARRADPDGGVPAEGEREPGRRDVEHERARRHARGGAGVDPRREPIAAEGAEHRRERTERHRHGDDAEQPQHEHARGEGDAPRRQREQVGKAGRLALAVDIQAAHDRDHEGHERTDKLDERVRAEARIPRRHAEVGPAGNAGDKAARQVQRDQRRAPKPHALREHGAP